MSAPTPASRGIPQRRPANASQTEIPLIKSEGSNSTCIKCPEGASLLTHSFSCERVAGCRPPQARMAVPMEALLATALEPRSFGTAAGTPAKRAREVRRPLWRYDTVLNALFSGSTYGWDDESKSYICKCSAGKYSMTPPKNQCSGFFRSFRFPHRRLKSPVFRSVVPVGSLRVFYFEQYSRKRFLHTEQGQTSLQARRRASAVHRTSSSIRIPECACPAPKVGPVV